MTLQSSGLIKLSQVNAELGLSGTAGITLNATQVRTLAGKSTGPIKFSDLYGKSLITDFALTITANQTNLNLANYATANGWTSNRKLIVTINPGVYILASDTGNYALTITASFPTGVEIINNGNIIGAGGSGGNTDSAGDAGGPAIYAGQAVTMTNNGVIAGGGGGGSGGVTGYH